MSQRIEANNAHCSHRGLRLPDHKEIISCPAIIDPSIRTGGTALGVADELIPEQLPVSFFLGDEGILPRLPSCNKVQLAHVISNLQKSGVLVPSLTPRESWRWRWCVGNPSVWPDITQSEALKWIESITYAVEEALSHSTEPLLTFKLNTNASSDSPAVCTGLEDGASEATLAFHGILRANAPVEPSTILTGDGPHWTVIGVPGQCTKSKKDEDEVSNWAKILSFMGELMQTDPRRRYVFAFTTEGTNMRIWFASRAGTLVSLPFNFVERYDYTIEFFLRLMCAEEGQLGWDTTMRCLDSRPGLGLSRSYHIECAGVTYKTVHLISDSGAQRLRGHGTRVWEVHALKDDGTEDTKPLVLKDSWPIESQRREGDTWLQLREDAIRSNLLDDFERYFVNVRAFSDVRSGENSVLDHTRGFIRPPNCPATAHATTRLAHDVESNGLQKDTRSGSKLDRPKISPDPVERITQAPSLVHHRIVFEEVGRSVADADMLSESLDALADAAKGLKIMHQCGWVHRDISIGNILIVDGVGKLADLEYAQREDDDPNGEGYRVGTPCFMSVEVELQRYVHVPSIKHPRAGLKAVDVRKARMQDPQVLTTKSDNAFGPTNSATAPTTPPVQYAFRNNPLHDLESLLWVEVWLLVCPDFIKTTGISWKMWTRYQQHHDTAASELFSDEHYRKDALTCGCTFIEILEYLLPVASDIIRVLDVVREALYDRYLDAAHERVVENDPFPWADMAGDELHSGFALHLSLAARRLREEGTDLRMTPEPEPLTDVKPANNAEDRTKLVRRRNDSYEQTDSSVWGPVRKRQKTAAYDSTASGSGSQTAAEGNSTPGSSCVSLFPDDEFLTVPRSESTAC